MRNSQIIKSKKRSTTNSDNYSANEGYTECAHDNKEIGSNENVVAISE